MFKIQKYKLYLFLGRIVGIIEGGLIEPSLTSMAVVTLCSVVLSFPLCWMQIYELQKLPDVPVSE